MRTFAGLVVAALFCFYAAWPAYTGYRIKTALDTDNPELLAAKIDFDSVRTSLRPAVTAEVEKAMATAIKQGGGDNEALLNQIKVQMMPKVIDTAMTNIVTPETVLRMHREGSDYKATLARIVSEKLASGGLGALRGLLGGGSDTGGGDVLGKLGKLAGIDPAKALGGLLGKKGEPAVMAPGSSETPAGATAPRKPFGLANIKVFSLTGPAGYSIGIARDAASTEPDVTAGLAFTGGDWKVISIRPRV